MRDIIEIVSASRGLRTPPMPERQTHLKLDWLIPRHQSAHAAASQAVSMGGMLAIVVFSPLSTSDSTVFPLQTKHRRSPE